jgi:3-dehydroquinate dehydratase / shikimate dehydrogenase
MAQLCVTIRGSTMEELRARRDAVVDADLVELRLDGVRDADAAGALEGRRLPVILTCRPRWEGGNFDGSEEERRRLLGRALALGAEFVDLEFAARDTDWFAASGGGRVILSAHDFSGVPQDLEARYRAMRATGAEVVKVAVHAASLQDLLPLQRLARAGEGRHVLLAMGIAGWATRILPHRFASAWTYAGEAWAPGQLPASRLLHEFRFRALTPATRVFGVVANPVLHSVSPAMHNAAFAAAGLDAVYLPLQAADAQDFLAFAETFGVEGASVTTPFKVDLMGAVEADDLARRVGAVNTLARRDGGWLGFNTDVSGLLEPLQARMSLNAARVAVLGSGGAARAAAVALAGVGARVTLHARRAEAAHAVAEATGTSAGLMPPAAGTWDLLVNATAAGMHPATDETPWPEARFDGQLVYDLVYNPEETRLLREARLAGCATLGGLDMLVAQAARQFEIWTGQPAPRQVLAAAARARLAAFRTERPAASTAQTVQ